ncbi:MULTISPECIES: hypothetical protein [unclassified Pseudactinotalea]|uniref:hypothetical protein n=1 Tax=Micrococcales TaxID=85006 RepID=UPI003C7C1D74
MTVLCATSQWWPDWVRSAPRRAKTGRDVTIGGFADSGFGRSSGTDGRAEYTQAKSMWVETDDEAPLAFGY